MAEIDEVFCDAIGKDVCLSVSDESKRRDKKRKPNSGEDEVTELTELKNELKGMRDSLDKVYEMVQKVCSKMDSFEERFCEVEKKVEEQSAEVGVLKKELVDMERRLADMEERAIYQEDKAIDQEARSRRNNLVFHGVEESADETPEHCMRKIHSLIREKCKISEHVTIERAHRLPPRPAGRGTGKPRPLIARFLDYNQRERVRKARRQLPQDIRVTEDMPWQIRQARGLLSKDLDAAKQSTPNSWIAYPARLMVNGHEKKVIRPSTMKRQRSRGGPQTTTQTHNGGEFRRDR